MKSSRENKNELTEKICQKNIDYYQAIMQAVVNNQEASIKLPPRTTLYTRAK